MMMMMCRSEILIHHAIFPSPFFPLQKNQNRQTPLHYKYKYNYKDNTYSTTLSRKLQKALIQKSMGSSEVNIDNQYQNVVVMRHGDRLDNVEPLWTASAARPWDPPLHEDGKVRAFCTGHKIRKLGFPIHRVFVSPFLRCLQTAAESIAAICSVEDNSDDPNDLTSNGVVIDPSKIKVSIEYGLCEMLNLRAIRPDVAPKDGIFSFDISQCEAVLPAGTIDNTHKQVYKELPKWQETLEGARARYPAVIKALADMYPSENLLIVSHAEGVAATVSSFVNNVDDIIGVEYCAYSHARRPIVFGEDHSFTAGDFVGSPEGQVGIKYSLLNKASDELDA